MEKIEHMNLEMLNFFLKSNIICHQSIKKNLFLCNIWKIISSLLQSNNGANKSKQKSEVFLFIFFKIENQKNVYT